ncbi:hypothetical protein H0H81_012145 [Sphagnurus paluster]|uniref:Uncharacterized protein n=1 Tax=Sphagnurus paluster TaxID=117069 RepID=A0A9P7K3A7_9AGAR|nr:hypothetical protein H0H81_012145 [Sphagnurus paluster]
MGDLSDADMAHSFWAFSPLDDPAVTWTLASSSTRTLPPPIALDWNNDTVYFSEVVLSQLVPGGKGLGTFDSNSFASAQNLEKPSNLTVEENIQETTPGAILSITRSAANFTYVFTPHAVLRSLFSSFDLEYPKLKPFNTSRLLKENDTLPVHLNPLDIAFGTRFADNGNAIEVFSGQISGGKDGNGWIAVEQVLVRLNTTYTGNADLARLSEESRPNRFKKPTWLGYDCGVCVQLVQPWVLDVYNSTTGLPASLRIVEPGMVIHNKGEEREIGNLTLKWNRVLESAKAPMQKVYTATRSSSMNQMIKDNGKADNYVLSPTILSFSKATQQVRYYAGLSPTYLASSLGSRDATNMLPYFVGSGPIVARRYNDRIVASASIEQLPTLFCLGFIMLIGLFAGLFVPKLPMNVPHRGFEMYTWMAAFHGHELVGEGTDVEIAPNMELDEIE